MGSLLLSTVGIHSPFKWMCNRVHAIACKAYEGTGGYEPLGDQSGTSVLLYLFDFNVTAAPKRAPQGDPASSGLAEWW